MGLLSKRKKQKPPRGDGVVNRAERRVEQLLELPVGLLSGSSRMEITGNRQAVVEGCRGVLAYDEDLIRLNTVNGTLSFHGRGLSLGCLTRDGAVVSGFILSVEFQY